MKIRILSRSSYRGGAARAAYRLFDALTKYQNFNCEVELQVAEANSKEANIIQPNSNFEYGWNQLRKYIGYKVNKLQRPSDFGFRSTSILPSVLHKKINKCNADIINIHWFQGEMISIRGVSKISKPKIFTLHDCWSFCGSEHYPRDFSDLRYKEGYTRENRSISDRGIDIDRLCWEFKRRSWTEKNQIICPSNWLAKCVKNSKLMENWPVTVIPNPLPISIYKPWPKNFAKEIFGLKQNKKYILFGALEGNDPRKGWDLIEPILPKIYKSLPDIELIVLGNKSSLTSINHSIKINYIGKLNDDQSLSMLYSASDLVVVPSRMENLPQAATEAQSCGVPVVSFNSSGLPDVVSHKETGYLAKCFDPNSLLDGIVWVLKDPLRCNKLSEQSRLRAENLWNPSIIAEKYMRVFEKVYNGQFVY